MYERMSKLGADLIKDGKQIQRIICIKLATCTAGDIVTLLHLLYELSED